MENNFKNKSFLIIIIFLVAFSLSGCSDEKKVWTGYYYPDIQKTNTENAKIEIGFESLDQCKKWARSVSRGDGKEDYECAYDCRYDENFKTAVCKESYQ